MIEKSGSFRLPIILLILIAAASVIRAQIPGDWNTQANSLRGKNGQQFTYVFPGGGQISGRLWGTDLYTDDSSIATAAVHAGLITPEHGGTVTIEIRAGASSYRGSLRNGVKSNDYGAYSGSFVLISGSPGQTSTTALPGTWTTQADSLRGKNGQRFTYVFPGGGTVSGRLWGTDLYTDDSSIAAAAVHAGLITPERGGTVTIEIRPGAPSYRGSLRNGVKSNDYGAFSGSFVFADVEVITPEKPPVTGAIPGTWTTQADSLRGKNGQQFTYVFPGGGTVSGRLWGTDLYTDDSSIAAAAVHAGLITPGRGGTVTIEIRPGAPSYRGSLRNGVKSNDYGAFSGSFVFTDVEVITPEKPPVTGAIQGTWTTQADSLRGKNGQRFTYVFPGGGTVSGRLWGTDLYTDDSSIAAAAVHAGLITPGRGGTVTIEIRAGASSYRGSLRNGVKSNDYGAYHGSFMFPDSSGGDDDPPPAGVTDLTGSWSDGLLHIWQDGDRLLVTAAWKNTGGSYPGWRVFRGEGTIQGREVRFFNVVYSQPGQRQSSGQYEYRLTLSPDGNVMDGYCLINGVRENQTYQYRRDN